MYGRRPERISLVIPALDEEDAIDHVVREFRGLRQPSGASWLEEVVVADNGSRDLTAERARNAGASVVYAPERGYGTACLAGIAYLAARASGPPEIVVFADGDGSNVPGDLPDLVQPLLEGRVDLVIGSRVARGDADGLTPPQRFGNLLATRLFRILYGVQATDLGPFRAIRWSRLVELQMSDPNYGWTVEMQIKAAKLGLSVAEVDVGNRRRVAGQSKVAGTVRGVVGAGVKIIGTLIIHARR